MISYSCVASKLTMKKLVFWGYLSCLFEVNLFARPEILQNEMKVFFVKYNDPIYVKLEKLDIMIRLTTSANIAQVLAELKEYATEVDVDFVRKSVRAIGRCAIKVEQAAERCVTTLLELIQTKVNYVVQEAIVVIKDIFRKYPNKYESVISTLCENLDSLDEPDAKASMIWIVGEYADRIDNADDLLRSFLEGFQDENTMVQLQLLTAIVKLFLKKPTETQELVQQVLNLATQESDNPDLRDRGYIYWRLLSTDPAAAREVVLAEKPLISEETDRLEPSLLDELICHISTLASVYHKPPSAFVEGKTPVRRMTLPQKAEVSASESTEVPPPGAGFAPAPGAGFAPAPGAGFAPAPAAIQQPTVIQAPQDSLIGDLLSMDLGPPQPQVAAMPAAMPAAMGGSAGMDLLASGLDELLGGVTQAQGQAPPPTAIQHGGAAPAPAGALGDLFSLQGGLGVTGTAYIVPKAVWLPAAKGKGLEIFGSFSRRQNQLYMDMTFSNRAMQAMFGFAVQFNRNSFGLIPAAALQVPEPLLPGASAEVSLPVNTIGPVQRMEPLNQLQVAVKNNIDVMYFTAAVSYNSLWTEDGQMERKVYLATWKDIPFSNEFQFTVSEIQITADAAQQKLSGNNIFLIAKRNVDGQDLLYVSLKFTNGIWVLGELKMQPGIPVIQIALKTRAGDVVPGVQQMLEQILRS
jgi:AP-1 complex subunit beta-1